MTGAVARLGITQTTARAYAWLAFSLTVLPLVPLPALAIEAREGLVGGGLAGAPEAMLSLVVATPVWATIPFLIGGALGTLFHLVLTAPERFTAIAAGREARIDVRSLVASGLLVGAMFAASGLALATSLLCTR